MFSLILNYFWLTISLQFYFTFENKLNGLKWKEVKLGTYQTINKTTTFFKIFFKNEKWFLQSDN